MPKQFDAYAPPIIWGPYLNIQSHGGSVSFTISYKPVGNTLVKGKVRYWKETDKKIELEFLDRITIKTANVWGNIDVCFKGIPLGSAVQGSIS